MSCPVAPLPAGLFPDACEVFWIIRPRRLAPASGLLFTDAPTAWEFSLPVTPVARLPARFSQMPRPVGCTGIRCGTLSWLDAGWQTRVLPYAYEIRVWIISWGLFPAFSSYPSDIKYVNCIRFVLLGSSPLDDQSRP